MLCRDHCCIFFMNNTVSWGKFLISELRTFQTMNTLVSRNSEVLLYIWTPQPITLPRLRCACGVITTLHTIISRLEKWFPLWGERAHSLKFVCTIRGLRYQKQKEWRRKQTTDLPIYPRLKYSPPYKYTT